MYQKKYIKWCGKNMDFIEYNEELKNRNAQLFEEVQQLKAELKKYFPAETNAECNGLLYMKKRD